MQTVTVAIVCALVQAVLHWFPWRKVVGQDLPRPIAYVLGTLGIVTPVIVLFILNSAAQQAIVLIVAVVASGLTVFCAYLVDAWAAARNSSADAQEREQALLQEIDNA